MSSTLRTAPDGTRAFTRSVELTAAGASILFLVLQPILFYWRVFVNPRLHIPYDIEAFHLPLISYVGQCLRRGVAPLWDPYPYCGVPIHADPQAQVFYPFTWLAIIAGNHSQGRYLFYWVQALVPLHMILAGLFTFLLLRRMGLRRPAVLLGASVFQLGGYFASQAQHLGAICTGAWLPLVILAVFELKDHVYVRWIAILAIAVAMSILSGFMPATLVMAGAVALVMAALLALRDASWRMVPAVVAGFLAGAMICVVQLVPLWQLTHASVAANRPIAFGTGGGMPWHALVSLVSPNHFHIFDVENYILPYNFTFLYVYCGIATVILILLAPFFRRSRAPVFLILTILSAVWMLGDNTPIYRFLFAHLPVILRSALYAEFALMAFCCFAGITAALVLDRVGSRAPQAALWAVALFTSYDLIHTGSGRPMNSGPGGYKWEDSEYRIGGRGPELLEYLRTFVDRTNPPSRIDYTDRFLYQGVFGSEMLGLPTASGDNPFVLDRILRLRRLFATGAPQDRQLSVNRLDSPLLSMMNVAWLVSGSELAPDEVSRAGLECVRSLSGLWVYRNPRALPRFFLPLHIRRSSGEEETLRLLAAPGFDPHREAIVEDIPEDQEFAAGEMKMKLYAANRVRLSVTAVGPAFLATSEVMYPGWEARVNGRPQSFQMTNGAFRGLSLPAGTSEIVMEYHPPYLAFWLFLSVIFFIVAAAVSLRVDRLRPMAWKPAVKPVYYQLFRLNLRTRFWFADRFRTPQLEVPVPPAILRFRVSESLAVDRFLNVGAAWASLIRLHAREMGKDLTEAPRVLDFGCGCGRTARWLLGGGGNVDFHGVDVDADAVAWCQQHLPQGHFALTGPAPPLPYPPEHFDVVYCLSVFTHLSESMQDLWLAELQRILKPGGALLLTVHGNNATNALDRDGRRILQASGFVHRRSQKLSSIVPDWYQTSWHSQEYVVDRLSRWFRDIRYHTVPDSVQDMVLARRL